MLKLNYSLYPVVFLLFLVGCSAAEQNRLQQQELLAQIKSDQPPVIVDVRTTAEYDAAHLPGAIHIPFWDSFTSSQLDNVTHQQTIVLYCEHGPRAGIAKFAYWIAGFSNVVYLDGHMSAWRKASLPLEKCSSC